MLDAVCGEGIVFHNTSISIRPTFSPCAKSRQQLKSFDRFLGSGLCSHPQPARVNSRLMAPFLEPGRLGPIIDMEIEMAKQRKNSRGFIFQNKLDLSRWEFNAIEGEMDDAFRKFEDAMEKTIEKEQEKLRNRIENTEKRIKRIASEALEITFEKEIRCGFWEINNHPERLTIQMDDLAEDGYYVELDIREAIHDMLLNCCGKDGYLIEDFEKSVSAFAEMLDKISSELKTAVRPKEES